MKNILLALFLFVNTVLFCQVLVNYKTCTIDGKKCIAFWFKNETNKYQQAICKIECYIKVKKYIEKKVIKFRCNFSPHQKHQPDLSYIEGNPYVIVNKDLIKFDVTFEFQN